MLLPPAKLAEIAREKVKEAEKVNIIAWSRWGLAARMLACEMPEKIASVTTVCTPHRGLRTTENLLGRPALKCWRKLAKVDSKAFDNAVRTMSPLYMEGFNARYPDAEGVFYQSAACAMAPADDARLSGANNIISIFDGENDGVVSVYSALWGQYGKVFRGVSHLNAVEEACDEMIKSLIKNGL